MFYEFQLARRLLIVPNSLRRLLPAYPYIFLEFLKVSGLLMHPYLLLITDTHFPPGLSFIEVWPFKVCGFLET